PAAGGALGATLQQCGVGDEIAKLTEGIDPLLILPVAFIVTALIRGAQGSAPVAMITAVGVLGHFATSGQLSFHPVYLALAIGCGSKPFPWMNDSGFWVISKMSGMTEGEALRAITPQGHPHGPRRPGDHHDRRHAAAARLAPTPDRQAHEKPREDPGGFSVLKDGRSLFGLLLDRVEEVVPSRLACFQRLVPLVPKLQRVAPMTSPGRVLAVRLRGPTCYRRCDGEPAGGGGSSSRVPIFGACSWAYCRRSWWVA
nr:GntP family permease [bacterium]